MYQLNNVLEQKEISSFNQYISNNYHLRPMSNYLDIAWEQQKQELLKLFGGKTILKRNITITKPQEILMEELYENLISTKSYSNFIRDLFLDFDKFVIDYSTFNLRNAFYTSLTFFNNQIGENYHFTLINGKTFKVESKEKPFKLLRRMIESTNNLKTDYPFAAHIEQLNNFRVLYSQILNQKKISGKLCLSIHPLDYATASDNECGWSSCFSIADHSEHISSVLEFLSAPHTIIAYLEAKEPMTLYSCDIDKWSNKKWRSFFYCDDTIITNIKGYPYSNEELDTIVLKWLRELAETNCGWTYQDDLINGADKGGFFYIDNIRLDFATRYAYNDINISNAHNRFAFVSDKPFEELSNAPYVRKSYYSQSDYCELRLGNDIFCISCGEKNNLPEEGQYLGCYDCEDIHYCNHCEKADVEENLIYLENYNYYVCEECLETYYRACEVCGDYYQHDDYSYNGIIFYTYLIKSPDGGYYEENLLICHNCYDYYREEEFFLKEAIVVDENGKEDIYYNVLNSQKELPNSLKWQVKWMGEPYLNFRKKENN